jgi:hypothetical protein
LAVCGNYRLKRALFRYENRTMQPLNLSATEALLWPLFMASMIFGFVIQPV